MEKTLVLARNKKKKKAFSFERFFFIISFTIIPVISFCVFYLYVNFDSFLMAFQKPVDGTLVWTLDNFTWVFNKIKNGSTLPVDDLRQAFLNTFITFGVQIIMFFVGVLVSYFLYKKILGYKAFRIIFYLPTILSSVVTSFFYIELMNSDFVPKVIEFLYHLDYEVKSPLSDSSFANKMVLLNLIWLSFPSNMILWGGAFSRIPTSVLESARIDGAGWIRELFQIILPCVWPTLVIMLTTSLASIFGATGNVFLLTAGEYGTQTVSNWMYMKVLQSGSDMSAMLYRVSALALILTVISCILALGIRKLLVNHVEEVEF